MAEIQTHGEPLSPELLKQLQEFSKFLDPIISRAKQLGTQTGRDWTELIPIAIHDVGKMREATGQPLFPAPETQKTD